MDEIINFLWKNKNIFKSYFINEYIVINFGESKKLENLIIFLKY